MAAAGQRRAWPAPPSWWAPVLSKLAVRSPTTSTGHRRPRPRHRCSRSPKLPRPRPRARLRRQPEAAAQLLGLSCVFEPLPKPADTPTNECSSGRDDLCYRAGHRGQAHAARLVAQSMGPTHVDAQLMFF